MGTRGARAAAQKPSGALPHWGTTTRKPVLAFILGSSLPAHWPPPEGPLASCYAWQTPVHFLQTDRLDGLCEDVVAAQK